MAFKSNGNKELRAWADIGRINAEIGYELVCEAQETDTRQLRRNTGAADVSDRGDAPDVPKGIDEFSSSHSIRTNQDSQPNRRLQAVRSKGEIVRGRAHTASS